MEQKWGPFKISHLSQNYFEADPLFILHTLNLLCKLGCLQKTEPKKTKDSVIKDFGNLEKPIKIFKNQHAVQQIL